MFQRSSSPRLGPQAENIRQRTIVVFASQITDTDSGYRCKRFAWLLLYTSSKLGVVQKVAVRTAAMSAESDRK